MSLSALCYAKFGGDCPVVNMLQKQSYALGPSKRQGREILHLDCVGGLLQREVAVASLVPCLGLCLVAVCSVRPWRLLV